MKLIQVSDLHFVPPGTRLLGLVPRERFAACAAHINAHHQDSDLCIITGDLVDDGTPEAYESLGEALNALAVPYRLMIGNHDDRDNFKAAFPDTPPDENGFVQTVIRCAAGDLVLLDTHVPGSAAGRLCDARRDWLEARLAEAGARPVYIFMHHPPFDIGIPSLDRLRLEDPDDFAAALAGAGNVAHIFFGHVHRPIGGSWRGISFSASRATVHQVPLDLRTLAPVPYDHAPPAYGVILLENGRTVVHHQEFLSDDSIPAGTPRTAPAP